MDMLIEVQSDNMVGLRGNGYQRHLNFYGLFFSYVFSSYVSLFHVYEYL